MAVPDTLARKLALFADSGRIIIGEEEHCGVDGWLAVLLGQGLRPASYDPLAETTPHATARGALAHMAAEIRARAQQLPTHREYLARRGASAPATAGRP
jgi:tryptophan halogenase